MATKQISLALAATALAATSAGAQYGAQPSSNQQQQPQLQPAEPSADAPRKLNVSRRAAKALGELQAAVTANDVANIPAKLAAAQAVAHSKEEKYFVAQQQLKAAVAAKDNAAVAVALEAVLASGGVEPAKVGAMFTDLGNIQMQAKQYAPAASAFERALAITPNNAEAMAMLGEARNSQGRANEAVALFQRALQARQASGQKAQESWFKRAVAVAYQAQLPSTLDLTRQWITAYPSPASWRDGLRLYRRVTSPDKETILDMLRLARATGALEGDADFHSYAFLASEADSAGEARAVIDEAIAARQVDPNKPLFKEIIPVLKANRELQREGLPAVEANALANPAARLAMRVANAYYGYGEYAKAAELYRAALTKSGVDANVANLRLGMALARAGDKAGATAALNAVTGPRAELAKYWLVYVATRS
jgi:tetratricopeptide (TPR) repeat protein